MSDTLSKPTLPTFSWIGHLKDDDRELLSSYGEFFPGHPGNVIIQEGVQQTEVVVVISGELEVRAKQEDGSEILLARVGPGETLGEISLFDPGAAAATVTASEFSQLWRISDNDLMQFMEDNPGAGNVLLRTLASILAQRLRQMNPKAFGLSTYAVVGTPGLPDVPSTEEPEQEYHLEDMVPESEFVPAENEDGAVLPTLPTRAQDPDANPTEVPENDEVRKISRKTQVVPELSELDPPLEPLR